MDRRGFIKGAGMVVGGVLASGTLVDAIQVSASRPAALDALIAESGPMWEGARGRSTSAVLVKLDPSNFVYELTIPVGKHHPDWNIRRRIMGNAEFEALLEAKKTTWAQEVGEVDPQFGYRTRAFIYNGRVANEWLPSFDRSKG